MAFETVSIPNVELFATGCFNGDCYDLKDLHDMVEASKRIVSKPVVKLGHGDRQEIEGPALGYVDKLRVVGNKLVGDLIQVPRKLGELIRAGQYGRHRSAEIFWNFRDGSGRIFPRVLKAIALLGESWPAVENLNPISAVEGLYSRSATVCYDSRGRCYKRYEMSVKRPQHEVHLRSVSPDDRSSCGHCRFYSPGSYDCEMVDGKMGQHAVCDLFEPEKAKSYSIQRSGNEWHVVSRSGLVMGAHESEAKAQMQKAELERMR